MSESHTENQQLDAASSRLLTAVERLQAALKSAEARSAQDTDSLKAEIAQLRQQNESLTQQVAAAEARLQSVQSRQANAADQLDDVIGRLRDVLAG